MPPKTIQVRIDGTTGKVVPADRIVHAASKEPDRIQWLPVPGKTYEIDFTPYLMGSPFEVATITVPPGGPHTITGGPGTYKYDVYDVTSGRRLTDDPDVVVV